MSFRAWRALAALASISASAYAQQAPAPYAQQAPAPYAQQAPASYAPYNGYGYGAPTGYTPARERSTGEISVLYGVSAIYGVGLGVWFGAEVGISDPALFLIAPAVLGVAAPASVYVLDRPRLRRGIPGAIAAGALIGAGEGIGLASLQFVRADKDDAWGFRGLSRATAIGATLGAAGGAVLGFAQTPSPRSSVLMTSGVAWGAAIGSMFGYGATRAGAGYGLSNDSAALGGFIGYNVALVGTGALSAVYIPTTTSLEWMWAGAGIGFTASLPVYLFYAGKDGPPAKRGLLFSGTATTLGIAAGALFTAGSKESAQSDTRRRFARIHSVGPLALPGTLGLSVGGELD